MHLLFDFSYFFRVSFYSKVALSSKNKETGTLYVMFQSFKTIYNKYKTDNIIFALDSPPYLRDQIAEDYKANREKSEYDKKHLSEGFSQALEFLSLVGRRFQVASYPGLEADDVLAILIKKIKEDEKIVIVSHDSDLYQLMSDRVHMYSPRLKKELDVSYFKKKFLVDPELLVNLKAIVGDKKDNLQGVPGIGTKRAFQYLEGKSNQKIKEKIEKHKDLIEHNKKMLKLPIIEADLEISKQQKIPEEELKLFFKEFEFNTFLKNFEFWSKIFC